MKKYVFKNIGLAILITLILSIIEGIVACIIGAFVGIDGLSIITLTILSAILTFIVMCFFGTNVTINYDSKYIPKNEFTSQENTEDVGKDVSENKSNKKKKIDDFFLYSMWNNKFYKEKHARLTFLPCLIIGIVLLVTLILAVPRIYNFCDQNRDGDFWILYLHLFASLVLATSTITTLWIGIFGSSGGGDYIPYKCCKCGSIFSFVEVETTDRKSWTEEHTSSKDHYGTVGSVYENGKKVGEVKGYTGTTYQKTTVMKESYKVKRRCACCGHEDIISVEHVKNI